MVLTSHGLLADMERRTGVWLSSFADAYNQFIKEGFEVTLASIKGERPPVEPLSEQEEYCTSEVAIFKEDQVAQLEFNNTWKLSEVTARDFDAIFVADGHGALWDIATDVQLGKVMGEFLLDGKPVAMVGHGVSALLSLELFRPGSLSGRQVTCFTDTEEALLKRHRQIPFSLESRLKEAGAKVNRAIIPFSPQVELDGLLITGQNPASAPMVSQLLVKKLEEEPVY